MNEFPFFIHVNDSANLALYNHGVAIFQTCEGVHIYSLAFVAVHVGRVVGPHYFFIESDFLKRCPGIMKEYVTIWQQVYVVMAGMASLWPGCFVRPEDLATGVCNGEDVLAIGCPYQHEPLGLGGETGKAKGEGR